MKRAVHFLLIAPVLFWLLAAPAFAQTRPNVLIMAADADAGTLPRDSMAVEVIIGTLTDSLQRQGLAVFDETLITLDDFVQGRVRRSEEELLDIAKTVSQPPIDTLILVSAAALAEKFRFALKIDNRLRVRVLDLRSGQRLRDIRLRANPPINLHPDCDAACRTAAVVEASARMAEAAAGDLGRSLRAAPADPPVAALPPGGVKLAFSGFDPVEITDIEEFVAAFSGYREHRLLASSDGRRRTYWYLTDSSNSRLDRNLRLMLRHIGVDGRVSFAANEFLIEKTGSSAN